MADQNNDNIDKILLPIVENSPIGSIEKEYYQTNKKRYKYLFELLESQIKPDDKVLDIGIGLGHLSILLKKEINCHITGLDLSEFYRDRLEKFDIKLATYNLGEMNFKSLKDDKFDFIIFSETLEHVASPPPLEIFNNISRVLKSEGKVIITTPNLARLYNRLFLLKGSNPLNPDWSVEETGYEQGYKHVRLFTVKDLKYYLKNSNLKVDKIYFENLEKPNYSDKRYGWQSKIVLLFEAVFSIIFPKLSQTITILAHKE